MLINLDCIELRLVRALVLSNGEKIFLRSLRASDSPQELRHFINEIIGERAFITLEERVSLSDERKWLARQLREIRGGNEICLVAQANGSVVGETEISRRRGGKQASWRIAGIAQATRGWRKERDVVEVSISIARRYRGKGLGEALLRELIAAAKKALKPRVVYLACFGSNNPQSHYTKNSALLKSLGCRSGSTTSGGSRTVFSWC